MKLHEIRIRDPFVLTDQTEQCYYLYGTTDDDPWKGPGQGFSAYISKDLSEWDGPISVFVPPENFWATHHFWAPEVHLHKGTYYMLASFKADGRVRGVQVLRAQTPLGPFVPISSGPVTPPQWDCLDGTLFWDEDKTPWLVFSHEWTQITDGSICCARLTDDLSEMKEPPVTLFYASQSGWSVADTGSMVKKSGENYVTDGPWLHRSEDKSLWMLWSSYATSGYAVGLAKSSSGTVLGPWEHSPQLLFEKDGGHGMLFRTLQGQLRLALHRPNETPLERPCFLPVTEKNGRLSARMKGD